MNAFYRFLILFVFLFHAANGFSQESIALHDSIIAWVEKAKDESLSFKDKQNFLYRAEEKIPFIYNDSVKNYLLYKVSTNFFNTKDNENFRRKNREALASALSLKDSNTIANHYWDLGAYYARIKKRDSSYYFYNRSQKILLNVNRKEDAGNLLFRMASIKSDLRDYIGSETNIIKALKIFKSTNNNKNLYRSYNKLGIVHKNHAAKTIPERKEFRNAYY